MSEGRLTRIVLAIALTAFLIRLGVVFLLDAHVFEDDWAFGYETGRIARSLATGDGFSSPFREPSGPTAWLMPAYPALLALSFKLLGVYTAGSAVAILAFNSLASALTCLLLYLLASEIFGGTTALVAAVAFAVYPPSIWHSVNTVWDTSLLALLGVLLVYALYLLPQSRGLRQASVFGIAFGAMLWVNPVFLSVLPLVWFQFMRRSDHALGRRLSAAALATLMALVMVLPWLARNQQQFGRPFLRSNFGLELKLGNNDKAWQEHLAGRRSSPWVLGHPSIVPEEFDRFASLGEAVYVEEALGEATKFIGENPMKFLRLTGWRAYVFWFSDLAGKSEWAGNLALGISLSWFKKACHLVPLPFMLLGIVVAIRRKLDLVPILGFFALFPAVYYVTHVTERYRFPIEPFIVILASYGLVWLLEKAGLSPRSRVAVASFVSGERAEPVPNRGPGAMSSAAAASESRPWFGRATRRRRRRRTPTEGR